MYRNQLVILLVALTSCLRADIDVGEETTGDGTSTTTEGSEGSTQAEGVCGDGNVDEGEGCDDGNVEDGDGCPSGAVGQCAGGARAGRAGNERRMLGCSQVG